MLLDLDNSSSRKADIEALANQYQRFSPTSISLLLHMIDHLNTSVAFHAAWVLEVMVWNNSKDLLDNLPQFVTSFAQTRNESVKRHYAKIMVRILNLTTGKVPDKYSLEIIKDTDLSPIVEAAFDWLINGKTRVAVKVHCIELLSRLSGRYAWIKDELPAVVEQQMQEGSPAMLAVGKRVLRQLAIKP